MATEIVPHEKQELAREEATRPGRSFVPRVDIHETGDALWLWADLPGVDEKSLDVRLENGELSIEGRVSLEGYESLTPVYTEYNVGHYLRSFRLSDRIDIDRIEAKMTNGVLELQLPKLATAKPRQISISVG